MTTAQYFFGQRGLVVLPIEELSAAGIEPGFQSALRRHTPLAQGWIDLFNASFATYFERAADLAARAPQHWFPPRVQHVAIVTDPAAVRPYFQPFHRASWLLYASDFDPERSNRELGAYQLLHVERMGLLQQVVPALTANLSYFLARSDDEVEAFAAAARRCRRPDASGYDALASALPWIRGLHHETLRPPPLVRDGALLTVPGTGLIVPRADEHRLRDLVQAWSATAQRVASSYYAGHAACRRDHAHELSTWLATRRPELVVTAEDGRIVWDPGASDETTAVALALRGITESAAQSMAEDWSTIDLVTRRFLAALRTPQELPPPHAETAQDGLSYLHRTRRLVAYNVREGQMQRLREPAPPFERLMLAARTFHEWAHLAADAGWIAVPAERRAAHGALAQDLADQLDAVVTQAPPAARRVAAGELRALATASGTAGRGLARIALGRLSDYQANLLARHFLAAGEMETYVRNNVVSLAHQYAPGQLFQRLARYAYEYQYLSFAAIERPLDYFLASTFFREQYLDSQVLTRAQLERLLATVAEIAGAHEIDRTHIELPAVAP